MARNKDNFSPRPEQAAILDRAFEIVNSVPYKVGVRWLFYRLLQEGWYSSKDDYKNKLIPVLSKARHASYKDWRPDTLADETRDAIYFGHGAVDPAAWVRNNARNINVGLAHWHEQDYYVEMWYEARAMTEQFQYYSKGVTLRPMGGQPSIDFKYKTAQFLERASKLYDKEVKVLYFGDLDEAGVVIRDTVETDVQKWCGVDFEFVHCGLTAGQVRRWQVPENEDKPGAYQWEALSDEGAEEIITDSLSEYYNPAVYENVARRATIASKALQTHLLSLNLDKY